MEFQKNLDHEIESQGDEQYHKQSGQKNIGERWKKGKNPGLSIFIAKTYQILENNQFDDIICWNEQGTSFTINDVQRFQSQVLPIYFRHRNFSSFVRQLNMYDFHKIRNQKNLSMFEHKEFKHNSKQLLYKIKRKGCTRKDQQQDYQQQESKPIHRVRHRNYREVPSNTEHFSKKQLFQEFVSTLPQILYSQQEIHERIRQLKHNPKYKCLNSRDDLRKIYKKLKHRRVPQRGQLEQLSIQQEIMVQDMEQPLGAPTLAYLSTQKFIPNRSVSLIASLNHWDEIDNLIYGNNI